MADIPFCKIIARPLWLNLTIYFLVATFIVIVGILYVTTVKTEDEDERNKRYVTLKTVVAIGIMILSILLATSAAIHEWHWSTKCDQFENFIDTKISYLKRSLSPDNLVKSLGDQMKGAITNELSRQTSGLLNFK